MHMVCGAGRVHEMACMRALSMVSCTAGRFSCFINLSPRPSQGVTALMDEARDDLSHRWTPMITWDRWSREEGAARCCLHARLDTQLSTASPNWLSHCCVAPAVLLHHPCTCPLAVAVRGGGRPLTCCVCDQLRRNGAHAICSTSTSK